MSAGASGPNEQQPGDGEIGAKVPKSQPGAVLTITAGQTSPVVNDRDLSENRELTYRALADSRRRHLLRLLDDADGPVEVRKLAEQVGLHPNTVRDHLDLLVQARLVTRSSEQRTKPGRPRVLYRAAPLDRRSPEAEGYKFLAEVLAGYIEATVEDPAGAAEEAGRAWGRYLVDRPAPFLRLDSSEVTAQLVKTLDNLGFAPREKSAEKHVLVELHDCPFREMARGHGDVVCSIHLGILRGMAEELGGAIRVEGLRPFVEPSLCVTTLTPRG